MVLYLFYVHCIMLLNCLYVVDLCNTLVPSWKMMAKLSYSLLASCLE